MLIWTMGTVFTFALVRVTHTHEKACVLMHRHDPTMPRWAVEMATSLACVALWPLMLVAFGFDAIRKHWSN